MWKITKMFLLIYFLIWKQTGNYFQPKPGDFSTQGFHAFVTSDFLKKYVRA